MTAWLLGAAGGYLTIKEVTLLLRQVAIADSRGTHYQHLPTSDLCL